MSRAMLVTSGLVTAIATCLWLVLAIMLWEMNGSDPAGRGLSQSFAGLTVIVLWVTLAVLMLIASSVSGVPLRVGVGAVLLLPASGVSAFTAVNLAARTPGSGRPWLLLVPVLAPLVIAAYAAWLALPSVRPLLSPRAAGGIAGVLLLVLSLAPWPTARARARARAAGRARATEVVSPASSPKETVTR